MVESQTELVGLTQREGTQPAIPFKTVAYAEFDDKVQPNLRTSTRWDYATEYMGYYIDYYRFWLYACVLLALGVWALGVFAPVGLVMIALGAKYVDMAKLDKFIYQGNGPNRTLVLVD